jgi:hypothetical protein
MEVLVNFDVGCKNISCQVSMAGVAQMVVFWV